MYARVVRFTDVEPDRIAERSEDGPPEGMPPAKVQVFHDPEQRTAIVVQQFETEDDLKAAESFFDSMDPSETPGTRASVDRGELKLEIEVP